MKNIVLLGYMGVGKTSVGKVLAKRLGLQFCDLDMYIEERYRKKISDLFKEKGETAFREIEKKMLHEVAEFENIVLSLGGGTPCFFDNMDYLNANSITVFLNAPSSVILEHLQLSHVVRPLLQEKKGAELLSFIENQIHQRTPYYSKAQYEINIDCLDSTSKIDMLVDEILSLISVQHFSTNNGKMAN